MLDLYDADAFASFVKDYLVLHPGFNLDDEAKVPVKVSEHSMQTLKPETRESKVLKDLQDWVVAHNLHLSDDELAREHTPLVAKIKEELARKAGGEEAARTVALANDPQIRRALDVLKVAAIYQAKASVDK